MKLVRVSKIHLRTSIIIFLVLTIPVQKSLSQIFAVTGDKIIGVTNSSIKWADYDNDRDLDLILTGNDSSGSNGITKIYRNIEGHFEEIPTTLPQLDYSSIDWGDFDNDGDLDFVISGSEREITCPPCLTQIFQNQNGSFSKYEAELIGAFGGDARWVDFDKDNDLDLYVTGIYDAPKSGPLTVPESVNEHAKIYRNDNTKFVEVQAAIPRTSEGKSDWGDYDNDGDPDLILSGVSNFEDSNFQSIDFLKLFNNDHGYFREVMEKSFHGIGLGSATWGDYDNDGDLDILALGSSIGDVSPFRIYENQQCGFQPIELDSKITGGSAVTDWGDYDNDGDLDILASGICICSPWTASQLTKIYQNQSGEYTDADLDLIPLVRGSLTSGDFDNDGDSDFIISGWSNATLDNSPYFKTQTIIYRNELKRGVFRQNTIPDQPSGLNTIINGNSIFLSWQPASDAETESAALTYNVYIQDLDGNKFLVAPLSNLADGYRKIVSAGNAGYNKYFRIENLPKGNYAWSVQAIDNGFLASGFAQSQTFSINSAAQVPNVITPNGDGINENFIIGNAQSGWSLDVVNRWGNSVHHSDDYKNDWGGDGLSAGVYFYSLRDRCGELQVKGTLSLLRE